MDTLHRTVNPSLTIAGRDYRVLCYTLSERLSTPSELSCELFDDHAPLPRPGEVIGKAASFTLSRSDGSQTRAFAGDVVRAELGPDADDVPSLRILVVPHLFPLQKRATCRTFQELSAVDIVKKVLQGAGVPAAAQSWQLGDEHPSRRYVVQYRETDLDFILRLLAEEGIYFATHCDDGQVHLVFGDAPDGFGQIQGPPSLPFFDQFGFEDPADRILALAGAVSVRSDKAFTRDYNPAKPAVLVEGAAEGTDTGPHVLEVYAYPARADSAKRATHLARVIAESAQCERDQVEGETASLALVPGFRFSVEGHPYDPLNREYLVVSSRIEGSEARTFAAGDGRASRFVAAFSAVPTATVRYRPPRRAHEQTVAGTQTATITGAGGEEIHTDEHGRVKISYHWDREGKKDDSSSLWVRTLQTPLGGSMLLPRVGWEVSVCHRGGDVDHPFVLGRLTNALAPPPYALPQHAARSALGTATSPGGGSVNELRTTDTKGSEEMSFNASKDMSTHAKNNATESIGANLQKTVGGNQTNDITNSATASITGNQTLSVGGNQAVNVETFQVDQVGSHTLSIGGNRDLKVGGDHKRDVGADSSVHVGGNRIDLVVGSVTNATLASYDHDVGAALVELAVGNRTVSVGADRSEEAAAAKIIAANGGRGVQVGGALNVKVGGAIVNVANANRQDAAGGPYLELAAGAQIVKATNVVFEAKSALTLAMGGSIVSLTKASAIILGASVKLDGDVADTAVLVVDN